MVKETIFSLSEDATQALEVVSRNSNSSVQKVFMKYLLEEGNLDDSDLGIMIDSLLERDGSSFEDEIETIGEQILDRAAIECPLDKG